MYDKEAVDNTSWAGHFTEHMGVWTVQLMIGCGNVYRSRPGGKAT